MRTELACIAQARRSVWRGAQAGPHRQAQEWTAILMFLEGRRILEVGFPQESRQGSDPAEQMPRRDNRHSQYRPSTVDRRLDWCRGSQAEAATAQSILHGGVHSPAEYPVS